MRVTGVVETGSFTPSRAFERVRAATLVITDDAANSPQSVQLSGTGAAPPPGTPVVKLTPNNISFGMVTQGVGSTAQVITLTSAGTGSAKPGRVLLPNSFGQ